MKILVLSLLRVGDFIMQESVIADLFQKYPRAEIHILVNDVTEAYVRQSQRYTNIHVLPRKHLQMALVENDRPKLSAYLGLSKFVAKINQENFNLTINLSHTLFSARLMDLLKSEVKKGMQFTDGEVVPVSNPWLKYMNDSFSQNSKSPFQTMNLLAKSVDLDLQLPVFPKKISGYSHVAIQVTTSDVKKTWPIKHFRELAALLQSQFPEIQISILGAPNELQFLKQNFSENRKLKIETLNWADLTKLMNSADLLITGDTSVQHLAVQTGTPILSLFLGSANPNKTAPMQPGALLLEPRTSCFPCKHSSNCHQPSHYCAEDLSVEDVNAVLTSLLRQTALPEIRSHIYQVEMNQKYFFSLKKLGKGGSVLNLKRTLEQMTWQIYLDQGHLELAGPFGSAAYSFIQENSVSLRQTFNKNWLANRCAEFQCHELFLKEFESSFVNQFASELVVSSNPKPSNAKTKLADEINDHLFRFTAGKDYFFQLLQQLGENDSGFFKVKKLKEAVKETRHLIDIELKLIKSIMVELNERNFVYVSGARTLSEISSATT